MLLGMMEQLTNKDILYEPMKELNDKFPAWMVEHRDKVPEADLKRYEEQQRLVKEIVGSLKRRILAMKMLSCGSLLLIACRRYVEAGSRDVH